MAFDESKAFEHEVAEVEKWWKVRGTATCFSFSDSSAEVLTPSSFSPPKHPRFAQVTRPYTAAQVVAKRGTIDVKYPSDIQGKKLWTLLENHAKNGTPSHTYGA